MLNASQEKEIATLRQTLDDLNKKLIDSENSKNEHEVTTTHLKDELSVLYFPVIDYRLNEVRTQRSVIRTSVFNSNLLKRRL